jgi:hypothetical protein
MEGYTFHAGQTNRGRSSKLWRHCPYEQIILNSNIGAYIRHDFANCPAFATGVSQDGLITFQDTSATARALATQKFGVLRMTTAATDNNACGLTTGGNIGGLTKISTTAGDIHPCWFECRFKLGSVADLGVFVGVAEEALAADNTLADNTGALAAKDFVGFHIATASPTRLDAVHKTAAGSMATVQSGAKTMVADAWCKAGFWFDGKHVRYFIDGEQVGNPVLPSATNFPNGDMLAPLFYVKTGEAVDKQLDLDWFEFFTAYSLAN